MSNPVKTLTGVLGVVFVLVGILPFLGGLGLVGDGQLFHTNVGHDLVHILTGVIYLLMVTTLVTTENTKRVLIVFGIIYLLIAVLGFIVVGASSGNVSGLLGLGLVEVNQADNFLHVVLALAILGVAALEGENEPAPQKENM
ncbi:MAG: hypothetical protein BRC23_01085 [Parcubacteria group bacterium SW_4_49_11]|nr:MAG: hypothetical protein BRC23_01085 [Parcubacteria group bacterium SW_4_49_11]